MTLPDDLAVLLVAHGTVASPEEMPAFLRLIRRGRPPSTSLVEQMRQRYELIGGSPLLEETTAQARHLAAALARPVYVGMRYSKPTIEAALEQAALARVRQLVVIPMAPYNVPLYTREVWSRYQTLVRASARQMELLSVPAWGSTPELVTAHADNILTHAGKPLSRGARLLLTAHSLPQRVIDAGDRYAVDVRVAAQAIGDRLGIPYLLGFQSESSDGGQWLGPSILQRLEALAQSGASEVVVAPFGFLCEHVETLYDLDHEFAEQARARGVTLHRVPALGTHPGLIRTLSYLVDSSWLRRQNPLPLSTEGSTQRD